MMELRQTVLKTTKIKAIFLHLEVFFEPIFVKGQ